MSKTPTTSNSKSSAKGKLPATEKHASSSLTPRTKAPPAAHRAPTPKPARKRQSR